MAKEPRPLMRNIRAHIPASHRDAHRKVKDCLLYRCVSAPGSSTNEVSETVQKLARYEWLLAHSRFLDHCWQCPFLSNEAASLEMAIDDAIVQEMSTEPSSYPGLWHARLKPGVAGCRTDEPNQGITNNPHHVTCAACLAIALGKTP